MTNPMSTIRDKALEFGLYLPLGALDRLRSGVGEVDAAAVRRLYGDLVERGHERLDPLERAVRRRSDEVARQTRRGADEVATTAGGAARRTRGRARAASGVVAPRMPRVAAPRSAKELPIANYDGLTAEEIRVQIGSLTQTDLARVYKYERAHGNRSAVLDAIDSKLVTLPIPTYDALTVNEIAHRLDGLSERELRAVRDYESGTKNRSAVLEAIDARLG